MHSPPHSNPKLHGSYTPLIQAASNDSAVIVHALLQHPAIDTTAKCKVLARTRPPAHCPLRNHREMPAPYRTDQKPDGLRLRDGR